MLRADQVHVIRHKVLVEGLSLRRVARELGVSRNTVRKYLEQGDPLAQALHQRLELGPLGGLHPPQAQPLTRLDVHPVQEQRVEGVMYESGQGVGKEPAKAAEWYRKAAEGGDAAAQSNLGVLYRDRVGVAKDINAAVGWFQKPAKQGHAKAMINLGAVYEQAARAARQGKWSSPSGRKENKRGEAALPL